MLSVGNSKVSKLYLGDTECKKAYFGDTLVLDNSIKYYTVTASVSPAGSGTVSGAGTYSKGEQVTLIANPSEGYNFTGWAENGVIVSKNTSYTFSADRNRAFTASFKIPTHISGRDWFLTETPISANTSCVTYGNDKFVALTNNQNGANFYSYDGIKWNQNSLIHPLKSSGKIMYGNGCYVSIGYGQSSGYSIDGLTWNTSSVRASGQFNFYALAYGKGRFIAFPYNYSEFFLNSGTQTSWTFITAPSTSYWICSAYGKDKFVVLVFKDNFGYYSENGTKWTYFSLPVKAPWVDVVYGKDKFVAISGFGISSNTVAYSYDGITWKSTSLPKSADWRSIAYGDNKFVAIAYNDSIVAYSDDGITWESSSLPETANWIDVTFGNGKFVVVSNGDNKVAYSYTGD